MEFTKRHLTKFVHPLYFSNKYIFSLAGAYYITLILLTTFTIFCFYKHFQNETKTKSNYNSLGCYVYELMQKSSHLVKDTYLLTCCNLRLNCTKLCQSK